MGCVRETADELWKGHRLLKTGVLTDRQTDRHTKVKTVYPPVSFRSLDGYKYTCTCIQWNIPHSTVTR